MCVANGVIAVEEMKEFGCERCSHFANCVEDAIFGTSFSTSKLGKECSGFLDKETGESGPCGSTLFEME